MVERVRRFLGDWRRPERPGMLAVGVVIGFVVILGANLQPPDPESRLPGSQRLAALIARQQQDLERQKDEVDALRTQLEQERDAVLNQRAGLNTQNGVLAEAAIVAGTVALEGMGFTATLDDSSLDSAPTGNVNDLVIHSQDVQAVVNAMWSAGAEAVAINGQRLVGTSAILCVGNTLLLNGTVHSPPYAVSGIGVNRTQFQDDPLVREVKSDAERFSLRFSVGRDEMLELPAYEGPTAPRYARPA